MSDKMKITSGPVAACCNCGQVIGNKPFVQALNGEWHTSCFRCTVCRQFLDNWYFEKDGQLYCRHDYWVRFGSACNRCSHLITGPLMAAGEHHYHPECFQCQKCLTYIGDGDTYALVERSRLFCGTCYKEVTRPLLTATPHRRKPHCIQLVEIPPTPDNGPKRGTVQIGTDRCPLFPRNSYSTVDKNGQPLITITELDLSPELDSLKIGDHILEVNGLNVADKTLEELGALLNSKDTVQVTIERDLSPLRLTTDGLQNNTCLCSSPSSSSIPSSAGVNGAAADSEKTLLIDDTTVRLRPKASLRAKGHSPSRRRSKSPSPVPPSRQKSVDLGRSASFHTNSPDHRVFRASDLEPGQVLGHGFFGQAILVTHKVTGEKMVIKELFKFDEEAQKNFLHEVSVLRKLDHPNVLKFLGVLYKDKKLNMVTEYIDGGTLSDILMDTSKHLSWVQRTKFVKDIAAGMCYLHSMNIIHRDLNSRNCFIRKDQTVVVADFGLAKILPRHQEPFRVEKERNGRLSKKRIPRKKRHTVVGNPYWMAPEMLNHSPYNEKVDVFSFGIMVCEVIARVSADPDDLPRSLDFGLNAELFHSKFCKDCPEPLFMLAVLCSQLEPDKRPSFEEVSQLSEALLLHVEHGRAVPTKLQGSAVDFYHCTKDRLYREMAAQCSNRSTSNQPASAAQPPDMVAVQDQHSSGGSQTSPLTHCE